MDILREIRLARETCQELLSPKDLALRISEVMGLAETEIGRLDSIWGFIPLEPIGAVPRSPHWEKVRAEKLAAVPYCEATGSKTDLEAHHIIPFHKDKDLELDPENLIVLARVPHFLIGHLCNWASWNPNVREDAKRLFDAIKNRPH